MKHFRLLCCCAIAAITLLLTSCESGYTAPSKDTANCTITFTASGTPTRTGEAVPEGSPEGQPSTRAAVAIGDCFSKLNLMLFNPDGTRYFSQVRTQYSTDENFGQLSLTLPAGEYTLVAVGHSSAKSATIKSPELVQFTASNGQKLTDTFCYAGTVTVTETPQQHTITLVRCTAMLRFCFTDEEIPATLARIKFDYSGGSANVNPTTSEGTTKSTQSETRDLDPDDTYRLYTFPLLATTGTLKVTISALAADGTVIRKQSLEAVPVTRNRITTYTGPLFSEGGGTITQSGFGFWVDSEWDGEDRYEF